MAELLHELRLANADASYPPIVAGGRNSCILHYVQNERRTAEDDVVLIDAGCEYQGYASDITRTLPVGGRFSAEQRAVYEFVLEVANAAIEAVRPGNDCDAPHAAAVRVVTRGLVALGLLKGRPAKLGREEAYKKFFMHGTSHWLGLDVHDVGEYKIQDQWRSLETGMVLTIEPGIYILRGTRGVVRRFQGFGVRIEDDVVLTRAGAQVLSAGAPRDPDEIEALMGSAA